MRNLNDMKYLIISFLIFELLGCSQSNTKNEHLENADLKEFYFPLKNDLAPTTYTYEVKTETQDGIQLSNEYLKLQALGNDNYSFSCYGNNMNLLDSTIFKVDQNGTNIVQYFLVSEENSLVTATVSPKLIFPWYRKPKEKLNNEISYKVKMYGALTNSSIKMNSSFEEFENLDNSITKDTKCAKIIIQTDMKMKNTETGEEVQYSSKSKVYDLKGIGLYKVIETNNYGVKVSKKLIEIKKST